MRTLSAAILAAICWAPPSGGADEAPVFWGRTPEGWGRILRDPSRPKVDRLHAIWALGCLGPNAEAMVPALIDATRQGQHADDAVEALVRIGAGTEITIPSLIERFRKEGCLRLTGAGAIGFDDTVKNSLVRIGGPAVPALLGVLEGQDRDMRVCAAEALGEIGPTASAAVPALIRSIEHLKDDPQDEILGHHAVRAVGRIGAQAEAAIPILTALLGKEGVDDFDVVMALAGIGAPPTRWLLDNFLREGDPSVASQLTWLGPKARESAPLLRAALADKRLQVRYSSAVALAHIDPDSPGVIPVLIEALDHLDDESLDVGGVPVALARFGPGARAALPKLTARIMKGPGDPDLLKTLVQIDPDGRECVASLVSALGHDDYEVADVTARCLGLLGPRAKDAVPALTVAMTRDFQTVFYNGHDPQVSAARALRRIGPGAKPAIPALITALGYRHVVRRGLDGEDESRNSTAAAAAAELLGSFGAEAKAAVPALIEAIRIREKDDVNWEVRRSAIQALGQIGPEAKAAIPALRSLAKETGGDSQFLPQVIISLYRLAPDGKELAESWIAKPVRGQVRSELIRGLEDRATVLGVMGRTSFETDWLVRYELERLDSMLAVADPRDPDTMDSLEWWFEKLGQFRKAGSAAIPRLIRYRKHPNPWIRMWAEEALNLIDAPIRS